MEYTLESIEERLEQMVKDLPGCDYYSAGIFKKSFTGEKYYAVDFAFRVKGFMRVVNEMHECKERAVKDAFIKLETIVEGIKAKPIIALVATKPIGGTKRRGRPRKEQAPDSKMVA